MSHDGTTPRIIAFLEKEIAYGSADLAGQSHASYPANVKIIRVPSTGRVGLKHLLHAFAYGADGAILLEDHGGVFTEEALREHTNQLKKELSVYNIEPMRLISYSTTLPEYNKVINELKKLDLRAKVTVASKEIERLESDGSQARAKLRGEFCQVPKHNRVADFGREVKEKWKLGVEGSRLEEKEGIADLKLRKGREKDLTQRPNIVIIHLQLKMRAVIIKNRRIFYNKVL